MVGEMHLRKWLIWDSVSISLPKEPRRPCQGLHMMTRTGTATQPSNLPQWWTLHVVLSYLMWALGTELTSSARAVHNSWLPTPTAVSPAPGRAPYTHTMQCMSHMTSASTVQLVMHRRLQTPSESLAERWGTAYEKISNLTKQTSIIPKMNLWQNRTAVLRVRIR